MTAAEGTRMRRFEEGEGGSSARDRGGEEEQWV